MDYTVSGFKEKTNELEEVFSGIEKFPYVSAYVHGSWADNTRTVFSDLDDLLIINYSQMGFWMRMRLKFLLNKIHVRFIQIDPLQHHGHWKISSEELNDYDESYMPIFVLEEAIRIQGEKIIKTKLNEKKTRYGLIKNLGVTIENIKGLSSKYQEDNINEYEMKQLIGSFFLVCPYIFQIMGKRIQKREAINRAREIFSIESCILIKKCSLIRENWSIDLGDVRYKILRFITKIIIFPRIYTFLVKRIAPKFDRDKYPILEGAEIKTMVKELEEYYERYKND